ncbi:MAG: radical SAM/SPASM domain-containing protein [Spirochaetota bacterium]
MNSFTPEEVIFAPTAQCNLNCAHCRVTRVPELLDLGASLRFLGDCAASGIDRVGFSGGEPFLRPDFIAGIARAAVGHGMVFDRLMTNGVWHRNPSDLRAALMAVEESGFDGTYGLSIDSWHPQESEKLVQFIETAFELRGRRDCVEIISVRAGDETAWEAKLADIVEALGATLPGVALEDGPLEDGEGLPVAAPGEVTAISDRAWRERGDEGEDLPEALFVRIIRFDRSFAACPDPEAAGAWKSQGWFKDDLCAGPGNLFFVHPGGDVAPCCGYANENPGLILGNIATATFATLMENAAASVQVRSCYGTGLGALRTRLGREGHSFPGVTQDQCFFCDYCAKEGLF